MSHGNLTYSVDGYTTYKLPLNESLVLPRGAPYCPISNSNVLSFRRDDSGTLVNGEETVFYNGTLDNLYTGQSVKGEQTFSRYLTIYRSGLPPINTLLGQFRLETTCYLGNDEDKTVESALWTVL